ncbi:hypothetical protein NL676_026316 [Syzygium grande]|nr:hypothetical protein NL676_026316 [Syzygium grande]
MRNKGEYFLGSLKMACLLESGHDDDDKKEYVKMHDVIRDMATWIARDHGQKENKLLVIEKGEDMSAKMISKWGEAEKDLTSIVISSTPTGSRRRFLAFRGVLSKYCESLWELKITQVIRQALNCSWFPNLVDVHVYRCGLLDLSWLMHAPKLRKLCVWSCHSMEKIIGDGFAPEELAASKLFSSLETLDLIRLSKFTSICDHTLFFPQGVRFTISGCSNLKKLPLDSNSRFSITADGKWWPNFEWDPAARVIVQWIRGKSPIEEMTLGEAVRKMKEDRDPSSFPEIGFGPWGPRE